MADKIVIEIYRNKNAEEFTKLLADPAGKLNTGSAAAETAALAAALALRAASVTAEAFPENERAEYIRRNMEIIRGYMVHLIDEDVKCRAPLNRALKEGGEREIEACRQTATCITAEIVNMMGTGLGLMDELAELCPKTSAHFLAEAAFLAAAAAECAGVFTVDMAEQSADETYRFVTRRENEINLEQIHALKVSVLKKLNK